MENNRHSKEEWLSFIEKQIQDYEYHHKKYGITLWLLLGTSGLLFDKLITYLFFIDNSAENKFTMYICTGCILTTFIIILNIIMHGKENRETVIINIRRKDNVIGISTIILILAIYTIIMLLIAMLFKDLKSMKWIAMIMLILNYWTNTMWFIVTFVPFEPSIFMDDLTIFDKFLILFYSFRIRILFRMLNIFSCYYLSKIVIENLRLLYLTKEIIMASLLINVIIILIVAIISILIMYNKENFYKILRKEVFLSNLDENNIEEIVNKYIIGESTIEWIIGYYKQIETSCDIIRNNLNSDSLNENKISELLNLAESTIKIAEGINLYFDKRSVYVSYVEWQCYKNNNDQLKNNVKFLKNCIGILVKNN